MLRIAAILLVFASSIRNNCAEAQTAANVLLVSNRASADSDAITRYYAGRRGISQDHICALMTSTSESISRETYELEVEAPIWRCIAAARAEDRILYIVLTKGVPIRINGTGGRTGRRRASTLS